jgi:Concanavalin A-like lectin/glucanases superfamily
MNRRLFLSLLGATAILAAVASGSGQTLEADYQLQGVYSSSVGSIGPLTPTGDASQLQFVNATVNGHSQQVLQVSNTFNTSTFTTTQAGVQTQVAPFVDPANYSAVLLSDFSFAPSNTDITKVMDFKNLSSDAGLYVNDLTGLLGFYDGGAMLLGASSTPIVSGQYVQIVLTRDSTTNLVTVYANGVAQFSFTDSTGLAVLGDATNTGNAFLTLYQDDAGGLGGSSVPEGTVGDIARLRLYDGVLSAEQVAALTTVVPEPATWELIFLGGFALVRPILRRR